MVFHKHVTTTLQAGLLLNLNTARTEQGRNTCLAVATAVILDHLQLDVNRFVVRLM